MKKLDLNRTFFYGICVLPQSRLLCEQSTLTLHIHALISFLLTSLWLPNDSLNKRPFVWMLIQTNFVGNMKLVLKFFCSSCQYVSLEFHESPSLSLQLNLHLFFSSIQQKYPSIFLTSLPCLNPPQKLGTAEGSKAGLILAPKLSYLIHLNVSQQNDEAV